MIACKTLRDALRVRVLGTAAFAALGAACVLGGGGGDDGEGAGGSGATSGASTTSSTSTAGGGDGGATASVSTGTGGAGGGPVGCTTLDECPLPPECFVSDCIEGQCELVFLGAQTPCSTGVCDEAGLCVECAASFNCDPGQVCEGGSCVPGSLGGVCGDNFCQLAPATPQCFQCIQTEGAPGGACDAEYQACIDEGTSAACTTCLDFFNGEQGTFCAGSQQTVDDLMTCMCAPGVCAQ